MSLTINVKVDVSKITNAVQKEVKNLSDDEKLIGKANSLSDKVYYELIKGYFNNIMHQSAQGKVGHPLSEVVFAELSKRRFPMPRSKFQTIIKKILLDLGYSEDKSKEAAGDLFTVSGGVVDFLTKKNSGASGMVQEGTVIEGAKRIEKETKIAPVVEVLKGIYNYEDIYAQMGKLSLNIGHQNEYALQLLSYLFTEETSLGKSLTEEDVLNKVRSFTERYTKDVGSWMKGEDIEGKQSANLTKMLNKIAKSRNPKDLRFEGRKIRGYSIKSLNATLMALSSKTSSTMNFLGEDVVKEFYSSAQEFADEWSKKANGNANQTFLLEGDKNDLNSSSKPLIKGGQLTLFEGAKNAKIEEMKVRYLFPQAHTAMRLFNTSGIQFGVYSPPSTVPREVVDKIMDVFINTHIGDELKGVAFFIIVEKEDVFVIPPEEMREILKSHLRLEEASGKYSYFQRTDGKTPKSVPMDQPSGISNYSYAEVIYKLFGLGDKEKKAQLKLGFTGNLDMLSAIRKTAFTTNVRELASVIGSAP